MPRHRIEHEPRHRARTADRRVQLRPVSSRSPSHAKPPARPGQLGKAFEAIGTGASDRLLAAGARLRRDQRDLLTGAVRGLIVSPWFAAGAGFVIAAGAFIAAPHAKLDFGNAIGTIPCSEAGCHQPIAQGAVPMIAGTGGGPVTASPTAMPPAATSGLSFEYAVTLHSHGMFQMLLTVTSKHAIGSWQLSFVIPGATGVSVSNATWQRSGTAGGTASGTGGTDDDSFPGGPGDGPDFGSSSHGQAGQGGGQAGGLSLVVLGYGAPAAPSSSSWNGVPCQFSKG